MKIKTTKLLAISLLGALSGSTFVSLTVPADAALKLRNCERNANGSNDKADWCAYIQYPFASPVKGESGAQPGPAPAPGPAPGPYGP